MDRLGKILVTLLALGVIAAALSFSRRVQTEFFQSQEESRSPEPLYVGAPSPDAARSASSALWPKFPRNAEQHIQESMLNGIQLLSEEWEGAATPFEVLAYYRQQMLARGWKNVTEEAWRMRPPGPTTPSEMSALQDQDYLRLYRKVMDSRLSLRRGNWSLEVTAEPSARGRGMFAVRILALATPSFTDFSFSLSKMLGSPQASAAGEPLEYVEHRGGQRYRTRMQVQRQTPPRAFDEAMTNLRAQNWRPLTLTAGRHASGSFAWLVKDTSQAALWVAPLPRGGGTSITFTEINPAE